MLGVLCAIAAAASFGFNNASARRGVLTGTALQGLAISMPLGVLLFLAAGILAGQWTEVHRLTRTSVLFFAAAGFMHFVWGRYFNIRSLAAVGSNIAGPVQQVQLLLALTLAVVFLGETLTPLKVLGILLVVAAPALILERRSKARARVRASPGTDRTTAAKPDFTPRMVEGYLCAGLSALGFGVSPILIKAGLAGTRLSLLGGFVSYITAAAVVALVLVVPSQFADVRGISRESVKWFALSGVGVSTSQLFRYVALGLAPVTIVQPLQSLSLLFRMIFAYFINRQHEEFDRWVIAGILLSFVGALALSASDGALLAHLPLPAWIAELASWRWP